MATQLRRNEMKPTKEEIHNYLIQLRDSGAINMFGAGAYLEEVFDMDRREARDALLEWMKDMSSGKAQP